MIEPKYTPMSIPAEALSDYTPDLLSLIHAELAGERPRCACRPVRAWPDGPVIGYSELCAAHAEETP